ncbi:MAG: methionine adenosyltransferase [Lentisphaeria bacterium]|nr:methionine adenosyltransferase [Lentisphaeria bacterium]
MSKINQRHIYTSESVSEGHPDKVCDQISDSVLDACLKQDPQSRVACETLATTDLIVLSGEITTSAKVNWEEVARQAARKIGYDRPDIGFDANSCKVMVCLHPQSHDIAQGVNEGEGLHLEQGAGDQGMMFGYASDETEALMPAPVHYSHLILQRFAELRREAGSDAANYLRPDSKSQVSFLYDDGQPVRVETVVVSHQHDEAMPIEWLRSTTQQVVHEVIPAEFLHNDIDFHVNPTGRFVIGGPHGDTGLTGRKIIVDTYGGVGCHGGGAFSGKDPSKVDRSAAYKCRYVAKNVVAAGLAKKCEIQVSYAIGVPRPLSINVATFGTGVVGDEELQHILEHSGIFDFRPVALIENLGLKTPSFDQGWCYCDTAAYGHFGRDIFPWEAVDKVDILKAEAKL